VSAKHTPGPWFTTDGIYNEIKALSKRGKTWVIARITAARVGHDEARANANLIAAAPETAAERDRLRKVNDELLEALMEAEAGLEFAGADKEPEGQFVPAPTLALRIVRAAIAKAKGEEP